jgi:hypothetical protein
MVAWLLRRPLASCGSSCGAWGCHSAHRPRYAGEAGRQARLARLPRVTSCLTRARWPHVYRLDACTLARRVHVGRSSRRRLRRRHPTSEWSASRLSRAPPPDAGRRSATSASGSMRKPWRLCASLAWQQQHWGPVGSASQFLPDILAVCGCARVQIKEPVSKMCTCSTRRNVAGACLLGRPDRSRRGRSC